MKIKNKLSHQKMEEIGDILKMALYVFIMTPLSYCMWLGNLLLTEVLITSKISSWSFCSVFGLIFLIELILTISVLILLSIKRHNKRKESFS